MTQRRVALVAAIFVLLGAFLWQRLAQTKESPSLTQPAGEGVQPDEGQLREVVLEPEKPHRRNDWRIPEGEQLYLYTYRATYLCEPASDYTCPTPPDNTVIVVKQEFSWVHPDYQSKYYFNRCSDWWSDEERRLYRQEYMKGCEFAWQEAPSGSISEP